MKDTSAKQLIETATPPEAAHTSNDGIDRRSFLTCMAWVGTGLVWTMTGGVPTSRLFAATGKSAQPSGGAEFSFVQISDSHIGFNKPANQDVTGTLKLAIDRINELPGSHDFLFARGRHQPFVKAG